MIVQMSRSKHAYPVKNKQSNTIDPGAPITASALLPTSPTDMATSATRRI